MAKYFNSQVKDGKLIVNKSYFLKGVSYLPDGDYLLCLIKQHNGTGRDFQKLYFAQLGEWAIDTGWSKEELHDLVKKELFTELFYGEISTADLNTDQWNILINNLQPFLIIKFKN